MDISGNFSEIPALDVENCADHGHFIQEETTQVKSDMNKCTSEILSMGAQNCDDQFEEKEITPEKLDKMDTNECASKIVSMDSEKCGSPDLSIKVGNVSEGLAETDSSARVNPKKSLQKEIVEGLDRLCANVKEQKQYLESFIDNKLSVNTDSIKEFITTLKEEIASDQYKVDLEPFGEGFTRFTEQLRKDIHVRYDKGEIFKQLKARKKCTARLDNGARDQSTEINETSQIYKVDMESVNERVKRFGEQLRKDMLVGYNNARIFSAGNKTTETLDNDLSDQFTDIDEADSECEYFEENSDGTDQNDASDDSDASQEYT